MLWITDKNFPVHPWFNSLKRRADRFIKSKADLKSIKHVYNGRPLALHLSMIPLSKKERRYYQSIRVRLKSVLERVAHGKTFFCKLKTILQYAVKQLSYCWRDRNLTAVLGNCACEEDWSDLHTMYSDMTRYLVHCWKVPLMVGQIYCKYICKIQTVCRQSPQPYWLSYISKMPLFHQYWSVRSKYRLK